MLDIFVENPFLVSSGILLALLLLTGGNSLRWRRRWHRLHAQYQAELAETASLSVQCEQLASNARQRLVFTANLNLAELTTRLQQPRPRDYGAIAERTAPERYRYAKQLSESGMEADQISSILTISSHEAEQLVSLSRISKNQ